MDEVVPALGEAVPVPAVGDDDQFVIGYPGARRHGQGPAVQAVEHVAAEVVRELGGLPYSGDDQHLFRLQPR